MRSLKELQSAFAQAICADDTATIAGIIRSNGLPILERLNVYRNNVTLSLIDVLQSKYSIVRTIVSDSFFDYAAHEYIKCHPSISGNLDSYGHYFAEFLAIFPPVQNLPYLPDIARYEWYDHLAHHAADATADMTEILEKLNSPEEELAHDKFILHPTLQLLSSPYPIDQIVSIAQDNSESTVALKEHGSNILFIRPEYQVLTETVSDAVAEFILALSQQQTLGEAYERAAQKDKEFDAGEGLGVLLKYQGIVKIF
jgi:hypothetical protein